SPQSAFTGLALGERGDPVLRRVVTGARREHAEVPVQARPVGEVPGLGDAGGAERRRAQPAGQRVLGRGAAPELPGRIPDGDRAGARARLSAAARPVALSALLRRAAGAAADRRRPPLRAEVWRTVGRLQGEGALPHRAGRLLAERIDAAL